MPDSARFAADQADFVTGSAVAGAAAPGDEAGNGSDGRAAAGSGEDPPAGRGGSLASVLDTLRDAASAHDSRAQTPGLPDTGPLPGGRDAAEDGRALAEGGPGLRQFDDGDEEVVDLANDVDELLEVHRLADIGVGMLGVAAQDVLRGP
jgi:hypothetical protein